MATRITTDLLIEEVRSVLDEVNEASVTDQDILLALNRGQDFASNILARHYEQPLLAYTSVTLTGGTAEYDIPEDALEQRLEKLEVQVNNIYYELQQISYRDITSYEGPTRQNIPYYFCVIGSKYRLLPAPTGTYPLRLWYLKMPEPLVKSQGRITQINTGSNYLVVDEIGEDVTTSTTDLNCYVNIIDPATGLVRSTHQVQSISGNRITFKSTADRSTVLGKTVSNSIGSSVELDDYVCLIHGTCVPVFKKPLANYLVQWAVGEMRRKLGEGMEFEAQIRDKLEDQVERSWVGRSQTFRVKRVNNNWGRLSRRFFPST